MTDGRARLAAQVHDDLTPRQREVMDLIAQGKTNFEIAQALGITLEGAKYHVSEILARLGVDSREQAVAAWQSAQRGWHWARPRILVPLAAGIAAVAGTGLLLAALFVAGDDDGDADNDLPVAIPTVDLATAEAWVAWTSELNSLDAEIHVRRGSQPDVELFPSTHFEAWSFPRWSPDGRFLAAVAVDRTQGFEFKLVLFDGDDGTIADVTTEQPEGLWPGSRTGRRSVFSANPPSSPSTPTFAKSPVPTPCPSPLSCPSTARRPGHPTESASPSSPTRICWSWRRTATSR